MPRKLHALRLSALVLPLLYTAGSPPLEAQDLCQGLLQDRLPHPMTALDPPAVGEPVADPQFGTTVRRLTAVPRSGADPAIRPLYATVSAWNADESLLLLYHVGQGFELYDGRTYRYLGPLEIAPSDIEQVYWHTSDPDVLVYPSGRRLVRHHVADGWDETVRVFEFCSGEVSAGADPMFTSWDSDTIGLRCDGYVFTYQISRDRVVGPYPTSLDAPQVAPSGTRSVLAGYVLDARLFVERRLDLANPFDHASLGRRANGRDTYNAVAYDAGPGGSDVGSLVTFDLADGHAEVVVGPATGFPYPPKGTHVSALAWDAPGWVVVSIVGDPAGQGVLDNEIVLADTNTGRVCRAAHHRSRGRNNTRLAHPYWAEPHAVPSPSGTRVLFASDWGDGGTVDTYVLELPAYAPLEVQISTNRSAYHAGDELLASMGVHNPGLGVQADLYLLELLTDGERVLSISSDGVTMGRLSDPAALRPLVSGLELTSPFEWSLPDFLEYVWTGGEPPGTYALILLVARQGSLADGRFDPGDAIAVSAGAFAFDP